MSWSTAGLDAGDDCAIAALANIAIATQLLAARRKRCDFLLFTK